MTSPDPNHLAMLQAIITRMAQNSFLIKGWSVAFATGLLGLAAAGADHRLAWVAVGAVAVLAVLDAYYLALERSYRALYDTTVASASTTWSLSAGGVNASGVAGALISPSVMLLHGVALAAALVLAVLA